MICVVIWYLSVSRDPLLGQKATSPICIIGSVSVGVELSLKVQPFLMCGIISIL